jgi:hypothetical protein
MSERKRRASWIDPRYQMIQALFGIGGNLMVAVLMAVLMSWFYLLVFRAPLGVDHNRLLPLLVAGAIILISLVSAYLNFRRSRSVAGMMRKIAVVMSAAAEGRFPDRPLVFRKDDYTAGLAEPLNRCLVELRQGRKGSKEIAARLQEVVEGMRAGKIQDSATLQNLEKLLEQLQGREICDDD